MAKSIKESIKSAMKGEKPDEPEKDRGREDQDDQDKLKVKPGPGDYSRKLAAYWIHQIDEHDRLNASFHKRGHDIVKRYRDDRNRASQEGQRKMNVLWSTTKIMLPALYSRCPIPIVDRKFLDKDPNGRLSSMILERALRNELQINGYHRSVGRAVLDKLLAGLGTVWVRYESEVGESKSLPTFNRTSADDDLDKIEQDEGSGEREDSVEEKELEDTGEQVVTESAPVDYMDWRDLYMFPVTARTWEEVQALGKKVMISRKEAIERFGEEIGEAMQYDTTSTDEKPQHTPSGMLYDINDRAISVYELWNKTDRNVYWVSKGYEYLCDVKADFLKLSKFFPTPEPMWGTTTNDSLNPVPDFLEWQDQAIQIDEMTQRIALLTRACKVAGVYDASHTGLSRLLSETVENQLIPVENWAVTGGDKNIQNAISLFPLENVIKVLETLIMVRQKCMEDLDLITGITDVMRGTTDSRETLGGMRLKNNNTGTRLSEQQEEVARFARDVVQIVAEVMCQHFTDKTLIETSCIELDDELDLDTVMAKMIEDGQKMMGGGQAPGGQQPSPQAPAQPAAPNPQGAAPGGQGGPAVGAGAQPIAPQSPAQPGQPTPPGAPGQPPQQNPQMLAMQHHQQMQQAQEVYHDMLERAHKQVQMRIEKAIKMLRKDIPRRYRIDIETDSTIYADAAEERENATKFIETFMGFMNGAQEVVKNLPEAMPLMGRMLQWGVRKYRVARDLEFAVDSFIEAMEKKAKDIEKNGPPPDPKIQIEQMKAGAEKERGDAEMQMEQQSAQRDAAAKQQDMRIEKEKAQLEMQTEKEKAQLQIQLETMKIEVEKIKAQMSLQHDQQKKALDMQGAHMDHALKAKEGEMALQQSEVQHRQQMEHGEATHAQNMEATSKQAEVGAATHKAKMTEAEMKQKSAKKPPEKNKKA